MTIQDGKVVHLNYTLSDTQGKVLDRADAESPFVYLHGAGQIVPGLEKALEGLKKGDKKKVTVPPAEGYGEKNPDLRLTVNKSQFPTQVDLEAGMQFEANSPDGEGMVFTVEAITGDKVTIDGNHPMAGQTLNFEVEVILVRDATDEEKTHGHAHGPEGHGHDH